MPARSQITEEVFQRLERQKELYVRTLRNTAQELETKIQELGVLGELGLLFKSSTRLEDVASQALQMFLQASAAENASIMLLSPRTRELSLLAAVGRKERQANYFGPDGYPRALFRPGQGLVGCCLTEGRPLLAEDAAADPRFLPGVGQIVVGSLACLPLAVQDEPLGAVNLSHPERLGLDGHRLPLWSILASYLAIAVSHALLFRELKQANQRLEERVRDRTRSLEAANRDLRSAQSEIARHNEELQHRVHERTEEVETALIELRAQHASLEEANRIKDEFLNNINHELKTPLNAVIGYSGLLLRQTEGTLEEDQRADLKLIEANGKHLQNILDNILSLKDIERGTVELDSRQTDLNELVRSAVASVRPRAQAKNLDVAFEPMDVPPVWVDPTLILRVVFNLLDNAVKFSQRGTIVARTRVAHGDPGQPVAKAGEGDRPYALVEVEDQGTGVKPEDVERIFQKFQQAEPPTRKREGGSGVGLTIAKNLVELHGGRIWLTSRPGKGSTFSFSLPLGG
jgi:signal transduction histidine kinase